MRFCEKLKNPLIVSREANVFSILFGGVFPCQTAETSRWQAPRLCFANMHGTGSVVAHYLVPVPNVGE